MKQICDFTLIFLSYQLMDSSWRGNFPKILVYSMNSSLGFPINLCKFYISLYSLCLSLYNYFPIWCSFLVRCVLSKYCHGFHVCGMLLQKKLHSCMDTSYTSSPNKATIGLIFHLPKILLNIYENHKKLYFPFLGILKIVKLHVNPRSKSFIFLISRSSFKIDHRFKVRDIQIFLIYFISLRFKMIFGLLSYNPFIYFKSWYWKTYMIATSHYFSH